MRLHEEVGPAATTVSAIADLQESPGSRSTDTSPMTTSWCGLLRALAALHPRPDVAAWEKIATRRRLRVAFAETYRWCARRPQC